MAYRINDSNLSNSVFGFGTASTFGGFNTVVLDSRVRLGGEAARLVPRNSRFMPFSDVSLTGLSANGYSLLERTAYAGVNRFILSNVPQVGGAQYSWSYKTPIYYVGGGSPFSMGRLFIGGTSSSYDVGKDVPPVILVTLQGKGGNGGTGLFQYNIIPFVPKVHSIGGGGGGSGAFGALYLKLPHDATQPTLVAYCHVDTGGNAVIYHPSVQTAPLTCKAGGNGSDATGAGLFDTYWGYSVGRGGSSGSFSAYVPPPNWEMALFSSQSTSADWGWNGKPGTSGSRTANAILGNVQEPQTVVAGGFENRSLFVNNGVSNNSVTGKVGGALVGTSNGGNGAGSMSGQGGTTFQASTGSGAGGGGGWEPYDPPIAGWGSRQKAGLPGSPASIKFYW